MSTEFHCPLSCLRALFIIPFVKDAVAVGGWCKRGEDARAASPCGSSRRPHVLLSVDVLNPSVLGELLVPQLDESQESLFQLGAPALI